MKQLSNDEHANRAYGLTNLKAMTDGQRLSIVEFISELEEDDAENSLQNAKRCLEEQGYHELQVMVHNYHYRAGINHAKNEIRGILGLEELRTPLEKKQLEASVKYPMGSAIDWDCPELQPHEFEVVEGSAKLIPLGEDGDTMIVIGTKDRKKAARMMRRYESDWMDKDLLPEAQQLEHKLVVWREAKYDHEQDHTHMFSWSSKDVKRNPKAISAFIFEG